MKEIKQAANVGGWLLIASFFSVSLFEAGVLYGVSTSWAGAGIATVAVLGLVFNLGKLYERHYKDIYKD